MATTMTSGQSLTPKGLATRERIIEAAAKLIYERGVHLTSNENVRQEAGVSGSQLTRHFPTKEALVHAVIEWRAEKVIEGHQVPPFGRLDSITALRRWARTYTDRDDMVCGGCSFGSLAAEVIKTGPAVRSEVAEGFARWSELFRSGLQSMRDRGELNSAADPQQLATMLMAAFQGGMLLDQAAGDTTALRQSLAGVISYIETFAAAPAGTQD
ncbi:TetR family transcriptional regulator [Streptomyces sp. 150FB]|uniref:TetR/AcrR family transcriptional regulator n=1 Tax=Streptomyces sp. 150FB TaxID=1576605 RepID=UPI0005895CF7|nr:TetR/AcrR family transcriptional regulator [Streptomyces sp. 150FB]KIF72913.1 TetR family transcriptional regulator [Streptomyces sp. 150FB]